MSDSIQSKPSAIRLGREARRALRVSWIFDKIEIFGLALAYAISGFLALVAPALAAAIYPWPIALLLLVAGLLTVVGIAGMRQRIEVWGAALMGSSLVPLLVFYALAGDPIGRVLTVTAIAGALLARAVRTWYMRRKAGA